MKTKFVKLEELKRYLDSFLEIKKFKTDRFNGLKVKGANKITKIGFATNCTMQIIERAIKNKANFLIVHHGGWEDTDLELAKQKWDKLKNKKISLYITHASLDCNKEFGTSNTLSELLGLKKPQYFVFYHGGYAGTSGTIKPILLEKLKNELEKKLKTKCQMYKNNNKKCKKIGIVAGGTGVRTNFIQQAKKLNCDTYICGSAEIFPIIYAKENKINMLLAGHTATETPAIKKLAKHLQKKFKIKAIQIKEEKY